MSIPSTKSPDLIVIGASARAACFSAARAGFSPYWIDQFGDADLRAAFPGEVVPAHAYPAGIVAALDRAPHGPVIYTGAMENHPRVLERIATRRQLLGNSAAVCAAVGNPQRLRECLDAEGLIYPRILPANSAVPVVGSWLQKPERSGGGMGIAVAEFGAVAAPGHYLQEFSSGESHSAVYAARENEVHLLGVTQQWVGEKDFHAPAFSYCGSVGPITPATQVTSQWEKIGQLLARQFRLRGLFGVDAVVHDHQVTVIEVNPRYTASVEVLEAALGIAALQVWGQVLHSDIARPDPNVAHGKAVLFAPADLVFTQAASAGCRNLSGGRIADLPAPGTGIAKGAPILTVLCQGDGIDDCARRLRRLAGDIYRVLGQ